MAVTITTNTLSPRVRYLNVSGSTANDDARDVVLAMADALIALGWSRHDTAGANAVIGTNSNAGVILRRAMSDNAQSGHFNYLGLRMVGSGTNTYTFHLIQAADWTGTTSMSSFVGGATSVFYTPNFSARTDFLNFAQGGTIWLFDGGKTLLITSQSGATLTKGSGSTWIVGEYKKEFGENVNAATGYIHNGVFTNNRWLLGGNGMGGDGSAHVMLSGVSAPANVNATGYYYFNEENFTAPSFGSNGSGLYVWASGFNNSQFVLTEAPAVSAGTAGLSRNAVAPTTCGVSFTTRMLMGYLGYIGQISPSLANSVNTVFTGSVDGAVGSGTTGQNTGTPIGGISMPFSTSSMRPGAISNITMLNAIQEYSPSTLPTALQFNIFEPTLSCGSTNGLATSWLQIQNGSGSYSGPQYKFSMLGRIFDMKIFGPYSSEKYVFLDSMTIPCDADGFYNAQGTNKDFWLIPSGNHMAFVMPK